MKRAFTILWIVLLMGFSGCNDDKQVSANVEENVTEADQTDLTSFECEELSLIQGSTEIVTEINQTNTNLYNLRAMQSADLSFDIKGNDGVRYDFIGTYSQTTVGNNHVNGTPVTLVETVYSQQYTNLDYNTSYTVTASVDEHGNVLESVDNWDIVCSLVGTAEPLPLDAKVGDQGEYISYECSDGYTSKHMWLLEDADNDNARVVFYQMVKDETGDIYATDRTYVTINPAGDVISMEMETDYFGSYGVETATTIMDDNSTVDVSMEVNLTFNIPDILFAFKDYVLSGSDCNKTALSGVLYGSTLNIRNDSTNIFTSNVNWDSREYTGSMLERTMFVLRDDLSTDEYDYRSDNVICSLVGYPAGYPTEVTFGYTSPTSYYICDDGTSFERTLHLQETDMILYNAELVDQYLFKDSTGQLVKAETYTHQVNFGCNNGVENRERVYTPHGKVQVHDLVNKTMLVLEGDEWIAPQYTPPEDTCTQ